MGKRMENFKVNAQIRKDDFLWNVRKEYHSRWMKACGVDKVEDIDYDNPFVKIEWLLCDPAWLHAIKSKKGREEFKERLNDPLAWWIFSEYRDEESGDGYWDLTANTLVHEVRTKYRHMRRRKNGTATRDVNETT